MLNCCWLCEVTLPDYDGLKDFMFWDREMGNYGSHLAYTCWLVMAPVGPGDRPLYGRRHLAGVITFG